MPFVPSDLSANAQPPENAVNEQTDRWTDRQTNNNIHKHPWMLSVSHLDTSACQIVGHFFQALCMQYTNPSPWMVGRTDERMKWNNTHRHQCWPKVSHLETSAFLTLCHSFPVTCQQMCKNLKMWLTDLLTDKRTDRRTDKRVSGGHYCRGLLLMWRMSSVIQFDSWRRIVLVVFILVMCQDRRRYRSDYLEYKDLPCFTSWISWIYCIRRLFWHIMSCQIQFPCLVTVI